MPRKNPKRHTLTAQQREDARDIAIIRREGRKPAYSFRKFIKELGYEITDRKRR